MAGATRRRCSVCVTVTPGVSRSIPAGLPSSAVTRSGRRACEIGQKKMLGEPSALRAVGGLWHSWGVRAGRLGVLLGVGPLKLLRQGGSSPWFEGRRSQRGLGSSSDQLVGLWSSGTPPHGRPSRRRKRGGLSHVRGPPWPHHGGIYGPPVRQGVLRSQTLGKPRDASGRPGKQTRRSDAVRLLNSPGPAVPVCTGPSSGRCAPTPDALTPGPERARRPMGRRARSVSRCAGRAVGPREPARTV